MSITRRASSFACAIALLSLSPSCSSQSITAQNSDLWSSMREGTGYVILLRHAQTVPGTGDPPGFKLDDCSTQRNLSEEGKAQAVKIGDRFRQQQIPIDRVLSSQWCRCLDTAKLMNIGKVEPFPALNSFFDDRSTEAQQTERVRQFILHNQKTSGAIVMVTHQVNITALSGVVPQQGEAVVMQVRNGDRFQVVGQLDPLE
ncbi:MAG: histidine phosphatase family protein [Hydrococcus sp. RU_2_2]|nr:histidine phosphatase family protein [Hydrococcus sp. RU_2_2]NJP22454.1 histidine phosphatase family protein [Hydrococcus sp. CRU_1_1]NJQ98356.1 histidine phosphatase family protein [Hydrococcus sp. CSU_1_8]